MMEEETLTKMPSIPAKDAGRKKMCEREGGSFKINFNPPHSAFPDVPG